MISMSLFRRKPRILVSAQEFGYGPSSILVQALTPLSKTHEFYFAGSKDQCDFYRKNGLRGDHVVPTDALLSTRKIVGVISCFDPELVIRAAKKNIPTLYIDNLLWFWEVDEVRLKKYRNQLVNEAPTKLQAALKKISLSKKYPHDIFLLAHFFSTQSVVQHFFDIAPKIKKIGLPIKNIKFFGALLLSAKTYAVKKSSSPHKKKPSVYVQLGSLKNPNTSFSYGKKYARFFCSVFNQLNTTERYDITVKVPPWVKDHLGEYKHIQLVSHLPFSEHLRLLSTSDFVVMQPGANSIYEVAVLKKPLFLLPEQTPSHSHNVRLLIKKGFVCDHCMFFDKIDNLKNREDTRYMVQNLQKLSFSKVNNRIKSFLRKKNHRDEVAKRYQVIKRALHGFNGTAQLQRHVTAFVKSISV